MAVYCTGQKVDGERLLGLGLGKGFVNGDEAAKFNNFCDICLPWPCYLFIEYLLVPCKLTALNNHTVACNTRGSNTRFCRRMPGLKKYIF